MSIPRIYWLYGNCLVIQLSEYVHFCIFWKCRRKRHRSIKEKETVTKAKSLFVGGLGINPKISSRSRENAQTFYLYINKSLKCCSLFKALSIMKVFSLTIHDSTQPIGKKQ